MESTHFDGEVKVIVPRVFDDHRGWFMEAYRKDLMTDLGIPYDFLQDNQSRSIKGVIRGLHFQWQPDMAKLMRVTVGTVFLVAVDIRRGSPTVGQWFGLEVSAENKRQVWAPPGFARGFCVLSDVAELQYKCTAIWNKDCEDSIRWNDPDIGIKWPEDNPIMADKDREARSLADWLASEEAEFLAYRR
ncbi:MAG: dTDP-4-dehydrorhamnose 3,5-epimerase [Anaerolineae bacterium]|nr:dTDP-4-dehydrorhamnose 3,5-epimerase [Anaerolineae bacterium]